MFTITIIIIAFVIWAIVSALTPKESGEIQKNIRRTPALHLESLQKIPGNIDTFHYNNGFVTIKMTNGITYSGHWDNMKVTYRRYYPPRFYNAVTKTYYTTGRVRTIGVCVEFSENKSVVIDKDLSVFSDNDWDRIYTILNGAKYVF